MFKIAMRGHFQSPAAADAAAGQGGELEIAVEVAGDALDRLGMLYDFYDLKTTVAGVVDRAEAPANGAAGWIELLRGGLAAELPAGLRPVRIGLRLDHASELWWEPDLDQ